jgi:tRNA-splicing ligase RtcB
MAVRTDLTVNNLAGELAVIRDAIERAIPVGGPGIKGSWDQRGTTPDRVLRVWEKEFDDAFARIQAKHPKIRQQPTYSQLGTLGTGNHFIEVCGDLEDGGVWFMLHSGSRGVGNRIGSYFIEQAKTQALKLDRTVNVDQNLAWLDQGTALFDDYVAAVGWAQRCWLISASPRRILGPTFRTTTRSQKRSSRR